MDALDRWGQAEGLAHMETISPHSARIPPESRSLSERDAAAGGRLSRAPGRAFLETEPESSPQFWI